MVAMQTLPHTRSCFVCGEANPAGLRLRFETDGRIVQTRFRPRVEHVGFKGIIHGGLIATILDEIMVWACAVQTRRFSFCAELNVRFLSPLEPGGEVIVTGELAANRKDRVFEAKATARTAAGVALAEATGKYLPVKAEDLSEMATDFVGDARALAAFVKTD
jgi:acyl-coenzyme A thioesterase PaaI-like protein